MNKHLNSECSSSKIFDDLVTQISDAIDNDEFDPVIWIEKDIVMNCGCDSESKFLSEYLPSVLEKISTIKRMDLENVENSMKGKVRIIGGLSYG